MTRRSSAEPKFLATLRGWFDSQREILVLFRYAYAAGNREFEFFSEFEALVERMSGLPAKTSIIAFRQPHLPIRGVVDDAFIAQCVESIPEEAEYLIVETVHRVYGRMSWFHDSAGTTHACLREDLEESRGIPVAAGLHPDWLVDSDDVISAIVPDEDGAVRPGAY